MARIKMVCATCGSQDVKRDAWAEWCNETQTWELQTTFDAAYCDECDGECHINEEPLTTADEYDEVTLASVPDFPVMDAITEGEPTS